MSLDEDSLMLLVKIVETEMHLKQLNALLFWLLLPDFSRLLFLNGQKKIHFSLVSFYLKIPTQTSCLLLNILFNKIIPPIWFQTTLNKPKVKQPLINLRSNTLNQPKEKEGYIESISSTLSQNRRECESSLKYVRIESNSKGLEKYLSST